MVQVNAGVKQGCLIYPSLFAVYINDLAQWINDLQCGIKIDDIVHFRNPSVQRSNFILTCSNSKIEYVESYKYLGLWFDKHINMNKAVREIGKISKSCTRRTLRKICELWRYDLFCFH